MSPTRRGAAAALAAAALGAITIATAPGAASEVKIFRASGAASFLEGELDGVSLDPLGVLRLAERTERAVSIEEPYLLCAVRLGDGWAAGTGNDGKVLRIREDGGVEVLFDAPEEQVLALLAEPDGSLLAATSPDGKVYRVAADGSSAVVATPGERYIWALARDAKGRLLLGTGTAGKLLRLDGDRLETLFDSDDSHVRSLLARPDGSVLAGTAGEGLVIEIAASGAARTLYDAAQPEISSLVAGVAGEVYAAALASEGSVVDLGSSTSQSSSERGTSAAAEVEVDQGAVTAGSRPASFKGPRSEVLRIDPDGAVDSIWSFEKETVFSMLWDQRLWVGTGMEGKLFSHRSEQMVLEQDVDELQIVAILPSRRAGAPVFATTNAAALYRPTGEQQRRGTVTSKVLDAGAVSRFGALHWQGDVADGAAVRFRLRTGLSPNPDRTWSAWSAESAPARGRGGELLLADVARGRYAQWQAILEGDGRGDPTLAAVELSYLQENRKPKITELTVLDPGQVLVPSNFNPGNQTFEPNHPNRDGIFTTLGRGEDNERTKTLWKLGYRTLQWKAEDPNGDQLEYALWVRAAGAAEDAAWLEIAREIEDSHLSFDSTVLPDGLYRFKLTASDHKSNPASEAAVVERLSEVVAVDHSAPRVASVTRRGSVLEVEVVDAWSPLREAKVSVDAGGWVAVSARDGLVDSRQEVLLVSVPEDAQVVLLRLGDASFNSTTVDLLARAAEANAAGGRR
ncbi:MAG TPA: hypothetical protein VMV46_20210 [Thermoanaerobaculia bacterium]|nr:hypothetical protein [Thermoanaerobaculia bacterium]